MRAIHFISNLALDAPLVAVSWWLIFAVTFDRPISWPIPFALGFAVWAIYLFDRIIDLRLESGSGQLPRRKGFVVNHPRLIQALCSISAMATIASATMIPVGTLIQAGILAGCTAVYFFIFRYFNLRGRLPSKELMIGLVFAGGVGLPFHQSLDYKRLFLLVIFGALCTINCLLISLVERKHDSKHDPSSWFSDRSNTFPFQTVLAISALATVIVGIGFHPPLLPCFVILLVIISLHTIYLNRSGHPDLISSFADAALWVPALFSLLIFL